ncbi:hypothetical protein ACSL103130_08325 [Actinomyces slackii]|uniref:Streptogramin lyase n=2 Tax=Actinomyces slackii TaxID=52774 RepID=A0A448K973_9ACTO|nr:Uncharacterised protein [Actinomyces slackii]
MTSDHHGGNPRPARRRTARPRALVAAPPRPLWRQGLALIVLAALVLATTLITAAPASAVDPGGHEEELPQAASPTPSLPATGTTTLADGTPVAVIVSGGDGGILHIVSLSTGEVLATEDFAPKNTDVQPWGFATLSNRHVLLASGGGQLFEIDVDAPAGTRVTNLSDSSRPGYDQVKPLGTFYWDVVVDEQDRAYIASHSDGGQQGRVLRYDTRANNGQGQWSDLLGAPVQSGETGVRSLAYENGTLYAGTGTAKPSIYRIALGGESPQATRLSVPESVTQGSGGIDRLAVRGGYLYVGTAKGAGTGNTFPCKGTCVLDPSTGAPKQVNGQPLEVNTWSSRIITRPGQAEKVYYYVQSGGKPTIQEYDPRTNASTTVIADERLGDRLSPSGWATANHLVSAGMHAERVGIYQADSGSVTAVADGAIKASPRIFFALGSVPGNGIYASWYMTTPSLMRISPAAQASQTTYTITSAPTAQVEGFGATASWMVTGNYNTGTLVPYRLGSGEPQAGTGVSIGSGQARPHTIVPIDDGRFAVASEPASRGSAGGAIAVFDAERGTVDTYPLDKMPYAPGVEAGSLSGLRPTSLIHRNGKLYVGTTGGSGSHPALFEFDLASRTVTRVERHFQGHLAITALALGADGKIYGSTGMSVFEANPSTLAIVRSAEVRRGFKGDKHSQLIERNGVLYGIMAGRLYAISTSDLSQATIIAADTTSPETGRTVVHGLALGEDGSLYFSRGSTLYRYVLPAG